MRYNNAGVVMLSGNTLDCRESVAVVCNSLDRCKSVVVSRLYDGHVIVGSDHCEGGAYSGSGGDGGRVSGGGGRRGRVLSVMQGEKRGGGQSAGDGGKGFGGERKAGARSDDGALREQGCSVGVVFCGVYGGDGGTGHTQGLGAVGLCLGCGAHGGCNGQTLWDVRGGGGCGGGLLH